MPLDLRRDAFRFHRAALVAADEPQGAFPGVQDLVPARADIDRIATIWSQCLSAHGGPFLFGERSMADAMYAPVVTRFRTYDVTLDRQCAGYCERIMAIPEMNEWIEAALANRTTSRSSRSSFKSRSTAARPFVAASEDPHDHTRGERRCEFAAANQIVVSDILGASIASGVWARVHTISGSAIGRSRQPVAIRAI